MAQGRVAAALETDLSPKTVTAFVERVAQLLGLKVDLAEGIADQLAEAEEMEWTNPKAASDFFHQIGSAPDLPNDARIRVAAGQARCALQIGSQEEAEHLIDELQKGGHHRVPEVIQAAAWLKLVARRKSGNLKDFQAAVEADPANLLAVQDLAVALFWEGRPSEAVDASLALLRRKRSDETRDLVLLLIEALGPRHVKVAPARRSFSSALFI